MMWAAVLWCATAIATASSAELQAGYERRLQTSYTFTSNAELKTAVSLWFSNEASAIATYGHISTWDTSQITDMSELFCRLSSQCSYHNTAAGSFNEDISGWQTGAVTTFRSMFYEAADFNQLASAWNSFLDDACRGYLRAGILVAGRRARPRICRTCSTALPPSTSSRPRGADASTRVDVRSLR